MHIEVLSLLATQIKQGHYIDDIGIPRNLVLVGHSMGSAYTNGLLEKEPEIADAAVLTGLAFTRDSGTVLEAFNMRIAAQQQSRWSDLDNGYTTWGSIYNNVNT